jgi:hypothetical protein
VPACCKPASLTLHELQLCGCDLDHVRTL